MKRRHNVHNLTHFLATSLAGLMTICGLMGFTSCNNQKDNADTYLNKGTEQCKQGKYNESIVSLSKAEAQATKDSDHYLLGQIYWQMAHTYKATFGYLEEIAYLQKASNEFAKADRPFTSRNVTFETGLANFNSKDYDSAELIFRQCLEESAAACDTLLETKCLSAYANLLVTKDNWRPVIRDYNRDYSNDKRVHQNKSSFHPELVIKMITRITNELKYPLTSQDRGVLAYSYAKAGNNEEAERWLKKSLQTAVQPEELVLAKYREYQIRSEEGKDKEALEALKYVMDYNNSVDMMSLKRSVAAAREEFLAQENSIVYNDWRIARLWTAVILFMFIAVIFSVIGYIRNKKLQNMQILSEEKAETEKYMTLAEELQGKLTSESERSDKMESKVVAPSYNMLERLCEQYYIYEGTDNLQAKILKEVKDLIRELREDPETVNNMKTGLDNSYNNIVTRLENQIPNLKEDDIRLYIFAASGLSSTSISTIMEKDKANIYNRIYRLKGKINSSDAKDKDEFVSLLTHQK